MVQQLGSGLTCQPTVDSVAHALQQVVENGPVSDGTLAQSLVRTREFAEVLLGRTALPVRELAVS